MRRGKTLLAAAAVLSALGLVAPGAPVTLGAASDVRLLDLDNQPVDPLEAPPGTKALAFVFVSVECPISNRYAPAIRRLHDQFTARGVAFRLIYPNPAESPETIRTHLRDYDLPPVALRDPRQALARFAGATITPEAAVYDAALRRVYRGRIDDKYVHIGLERPSPTRHDLQDALAAAVAGARISEPTTQAVGCFIADFAR